MVGLWEESITSNRFALEIQPDYYHAWDFMVYAHLQLAQDVQAKAMMEQAAKTADTGTRVVTIVNFTALAAMPARYPLERADWKGAAALPITSTEFPAADSLFLGFILSPPTPLRLESLEGLRTGFGFQN